MKVVILGATRGMGRALARALAERGETLCLLGRDLDPLAKSARDLEIRAGLDQGAVATIECDLERPERFDEALSAADEALDGFDTVIVTAAMFAPQDDLESDPEACGRLLTVNFANTVLFCENARQRMMSRGGGTLCVFSSVAGERGRKPIVLYGATKAGLTAYLEGLDHRYAAEGLRVVTVKPGFVRTSMTTGLPEPPFAGEPEQVARDVLKAIDRGKAVVYSPWPWRWVMAIIRRLPRFVMRRAGF